MAMAGSHYAASQPAGSVPLDNASIDAMSLAVQAASDSFGNPDYAAKIDIAIEATNEAIAANGWSYAPAAPSTTNLSAVDVNSSSVTAQLPPIEISALDSWANGIHIDVNTDLTIPNLVPTQISPVSLNGDIAIGTSNATPPSTGGYSLGVDDKVGAFFTAMSAGIDKIYEYADPVASEAERETVFKGGSIRDSGACSRCWWSCCWRSFGRNNVWRIQSW